MPASRCPRVDQRSDGNLADLRRARASRTASRSFFSSSAFVSSRREYTELHRIPSWNPAFHVASLSDHGNHLSSPLKYFTTDSTVLSFSGQRRKCGRSAILSCRSHYRGWIEFGCLADDMPWAVSVPVTFASSVLQPLAVLALTRGPKDSTLCSVSRQSGLKTPPPDQQRSRNTRPLFFPPIERVP